MGIQGLLPSLKSISVHTHVKHYAHQTLGVDAYVWLHRGAIACAWDLALGKPTTKYVDYAMHRVRMLQHYGITPYVVFDGDFLPSKAKTEDERESRRTENTRLGKEFMARGDKKMAQEYFQKAIDITPAMALRFITALQADKVEYVVAPYEADAQLAYLERIGLIDGIITEDSDLLVFGCKKILFKLNEFGECLEISRARFGDNTDLSLVGWDDNMFRYMAILSGCDYLANVPGMGLKSAHRLVKKYKTLGNVMKGLKFQSGHKMPSDYEQRFRRADMTFLYQRVFCPLKKVLVMGNEPYYPLDEETLRLIGATLEDDLARAVADGSVDPITKKTIIPLDRLPRKAGLQSGSVPSGNALMDAFLVPKTAEASVLCSRDPNVTTAKSEAAITEARPAPRPSLQERTLMTKLKLFDSSPSPPRKRSRSCAEHDQENRQSHYFFTPRAKPRQVIEPDADLAKAIEASMVEEAKRQEYLGFQNPVAFDVDESEAAVIAAASQRFRLPSKPKAPLPTLLRRRSTEIDVREAVALTGLPTPPNSQHFESVTAEWHQRFSLSQDSTPCKAAPAVHSSRPSMTPRSSSVSRMGSMALSRRSASASLRGSTQRQPFFPLKSSSSTPPPPSSLP